MCFCLKRIYDLTTIMGLHKILRASSLPIFIITLIINQLMARKWTSHFIFLQCHIMAYFLCFSFFIINNWLFPFSCGYENFIAEIAYYSFGYSLFNFVAMMSLDMFLTF